MNGYGGGSTPYGDAYDGIVRPSYRTATAGRRKWLTSADQGSPAAPSFSKSSNLQISKSPNLYAVAIRIFLAKISVSVLSGQLREASVDHSWSSIVILSVPH